VALSMFSPSKGSLRLISIQRSWSLFLLVPRTNITTRNYRSVGIKYREMIRVAFTDAAYDVIASTLPKGAARWPMQRDRGQCFIQVEAAVVDRMTVMRRPGESYSEVILRLVALKTSGCWSGVKANFWARPTSLAT
jgi:hypothetical protein